MSVKSQISMLLRKLNLLSVAEQIRYSLQRIRYKRQNLSFKKQHPEFVLPPELFIYETYRLNYKWYFEDGKNTAKEIISLLSKHLELTKPNLKLLDWGCGPGRIIRHFSALVPGAAIFGTDYNEDYVNWCNKNLHGISFSVNKIDPPTVYPENFFDAVIGLSIFTHLSEKGHRDWTNELHRIVKPGGYIYITTHGKAYYSKLTVAEKTLFDANILVTRRYRKEGNRLYSSFQSAGFIKKMIEGKFLVVQNIAGQVNKNEPSQDSWLLRKI